MPKLKYGILLLAVLGSGAAVYYMMAGKDVSVAGPEPKPAFIAKPEPNRVNMETPLVWPHPTDADTLIAGAEMGWSQAAVATALAAIEGPAKEIVLHRPGKTITSLVPVKFPLKMEKLTFSPMYRITLKGFDPALKGKDKLTLTFVFADGIRQNYDFKMLKQRPTAEERLKMRGGEEAKP